MNRQSKIPRIPQIDHKEYLSRDCQTIQVRDRKLDVRRMAVACLRHRCNLIPLSNVCKVAPNSLFLAPQGSLQTDWQIDNDFLTRPIMARNQILVRWEPKDFDDVSQADLIRV